MLIKVLGFDLFWLILGDIAFYVVLRLVGMIRDDHVKFAIGEK